MSLSNGKRHSPAFKKDFLEAVKKRKGDSVSVISRDVGISVSTGCKWANAAGLMKGREYYYCGYKYKTSEQKRRSEVDRQRRKSSLLTGWEFGPLLKKWQYWTPEDRAWFKELNCE